MNVRVTGCSPNGWLVEAHYFRIFLQLSKLPHFSTLQKFADRINNVMLGKIISSFVVLTGTRRTYLCWYRFNRIQYYACITVLCRASQTEEKEICQTIKLSIGADVLKQIICNIKVRRAPTRHDIIDFKPVITKTSEILPLSVVVVGDKGL